MLYLVTGLPQTGKTHNAIQWVLEHSQRSKRPVCHNGRFVVPEGKDLSHWKKIDPKDWQQEPVGTLFFLDACHHDFPARRPGQDVPDYIKSLVLHDREGMDFYLITQYPGSMDSFVLDLVQSPGWHRHLRRTTQDNTIRCLEWSQANLLCERDESELGALVTTISMREDGSLRSKAASPAGRGAAHRRSSRAPSASSAPSSRHKPGSSRRTGNRPHPRDRGEEEGGLPGAAALAGAAKIAAKGSKTGAALAGKGLWWGAVALKKLLLAATHALHQARQRKKARAEEDNAHSHIRPSTHGYAEVEPERRRLSMKTVLLLVLLLGAAAWAWRARNAEEPIELPQVLQDLPLSDISLPEVNIDTSALRDLVPFGGSGNEPDPSTSSPTSRVPQWSGSTEGLSCVLNHENRCECFDAVGKKVEVPHQVCRDVIHREGV